MRAIFRRPLAALPLTLEGIVFAILMAAGFLPADASVAPASAVFPLDAYFDLKQSLGYSTGWTAFGAAVAALVVFRAALLAVTARLADGRGASITVAYRHALVLTLGAVVLLLPVAALHFIAVATRYAPFGWISGGLGFLVAWRLARRAVTIDTGIGARNGPVPEISSFFLYAVALICVGAALALLSEASVALAALLVGCLGPFHASVYLGWRVRATENTVASEGRAVTILALALVIGLFAVSVYDRNLRDFDVVPADYEGSLLLMGGVDSSSETGALADFEPGALGYTRAQTELLSYRRGNDAYRVRDTRRALATTARVMIPQIHAAPAPRVLLGHSQASLIVDRMLATRGVDLAGAAVISPAPPSAPPVDVPAPGSSGEGRVGGDVARVFSEILGRIGLIPFDVDAPASPTNVEALEPPDSDVPRLTLWALADSILLDTDWRRPGEVNLVVVSDHVGATRNPRALDSARRFLQGEGVGSDDGSWRAILVNVLRYSFEPWKP